MFTASDPYLLVKNHPCAQCGRLLANPDWFEHQGDHISYLWSCEACDYRFMTIAYFGRHPENQRTENRQRAA